MILTFDPGVNTGWAVGEDSFAFKRPLLLACGLLEFDGFWPEVTGEIAHALRFVNSTSTIVVEQPQVYDARFQKGDQADIVSLSIRAGILLQRFRPGRRFALELLPTPREWKGQVDKDMHNRRVLAALSVEERALIPKLSKKKLHNVIDACGLFLWAAGRL